MGVILYNSVVQREYLGRIVYWVDQRSDCFGIEAVECIVLLGIVDIGFFRFMVSGGASL